MMEAPHDDHVQMDYWLPLRAMVVDFISSSQTPASLDKKVGLVSDKKKITNYGAAADGIKAWRGRKVITASTIASQVWTSGGLSISVTPELLISWPGSGPYVTKFYFSAEPLSKYMASPMLRLLETTHGNLGTAAVLDAQRGKLHTGPTARPADLDILLKTEASSFVAIWTSL